MSESFALIGYVPESYWFRRQMLALLGTMRRLYLGLVIFMWALLPWRIGWRGVGLAAWTTMWFAYSLFVPWVTQKVRVVG